MLIRADTFRPMFRLFSHRFRWTTWNVLNHPQCQNLGQNPGYRSSVSVAAYSTNRVKFKRHCIMPVNKMLASRTTKCLHFSYRSSWLLKTSNPFVAFNPFLSSRCVSHQTSKVNPEKDAKISSGDKAVIPQVEVIDKDIIKHDDASRSTLPGSEKHDTSVQSSDKPTTESSEKKSLTIIESETLPSGENLPSRIQRYIVRRYTWYLSRFQQSLETEMPDTFNMFRIFTVGLKEFIIDFKDFISILVQLSLPGTTLRTLSRRELEVFYHMPGDMVRVFPVLAISSIPFGQNIAFPIGYLFPRHLLCRHFWDIRQRHEFAMLALKKRLFNARPVFRSLQAVLQTIPDEDLREKCRTVFFKVGSGIHPTVDEIVAILPLFRGDPYHIKKMRSTHLNGLLRLHGRSVLFGRRRRLKEHARILHCMDAAISREGIDSLTHDQLKNCLFLRGLNPTSMSTTAMTEFLESWLKVSREIDAASYSLLLHLPILLTYNQPSNIVLIY